MKTPREIIEEIIGHREKAIDLEGFKREVDQALKEIEEYYKPLSVEEITKIILKYSNDTYDNKKGDVKLIMEEDYIPLAQTIHNLLKRGE